MEKLVLAIHDYQYGGAGMLILCRDVEALRLTLESSWKVQSERVKEHPFYSFAIANNYETHDFSNPPGFLAKSIERHHNKDNWSYADKTGTSGSFGGT